MKNVSGKTWRSGALRSPLGHGFTVASAIFSLLCFVGIGGCIKRERLSSEDRERLQGYVLDAVPEIPHRLDVNFANQVHLIGYRVEPEVVSPGDTLHFTLYWKVEKPLSKGWMLFTHMYDSGKNTMANLDWVGPLREPRGESQVFSPSLWEKGSIYVDEQSYEVPEDATGPLQILTGLWQEGERLSIVAGSHDGDNRALVGSIAVVAPDASHSPIPDVPHALVGRLPPGEKLVIDGRGDEKAWALAAQFGPFVDVGTGLFNKKLPVQGSAKMLWDDTFLYVLVDVQSPLMSGGFTSPKEQPEAWTSYGQPKLWTQDTVELMIQPHDDRNNKDYYEIQVSPQNLVFRTQYDDYNQPQTAPNGPFGHEDWAPSLVHAVALHGVLGKVGGKQNGYTVEMAIPWASLSKAPASPPKPGDTWRINLYAMKNNGGVAWSPIRGEGNFHKASRFGLVTWKGAP